MQAESGELLDEIVRRKELERSSGEGLFFWGIGNALGERVGMLVGRTPRPTVAFSVMRGRPKPADSTPRDVFVWTGYKDSHGNVCPLPDHVLLLSRGTTVSGIKKRHYALVCRSGEPLHLCERGTIHLGQFRNIGSTSKVGASQVTAILEHAAGEEGGLAYNVNLTANLVAPYFVHLAAPRLVTAAMRSEISQAAAGKMSVQGWLQLVARVRNSGALVGPTDTPIQDLFDDSTA